MVVADDASSPPGPSTTKTTDTMHSIVQNDDDNDDGGPPSTAVKPSFDNNGQTCVPDSAAAAATTTTVIGNNNNAAAAAATSVTTDSRIDNLDLPQEETTNCKATTTAAPGAAGGDDENGVRSQSSPLSSSSFFYVVRPSEGNGNDNSTNDGEGLSLQEPIIFFSKTDMMKLLVPNEKETVKDDDGNISNSQLFSSEILSSLSCEYKRFTTLEDACTYCCFRRQEDDHADDDDDDENVERKSSSSSSPPLVSRKNNPLRSLTRKATTPTATSSTTVAAAAAAAAAATSSNKKRGRPSPSSSTARKNSSTNSQKGNDEDGSFNSLESSSSPRKKKPKRVNNEQRKRKPKLSLSSAPEKEAVDDDTTNNRNDAQRWDQHFDLLRQYKDQYGDCNVPEKSSHPKLQGSKYKALASWAKKQRAELVILKNLPSSSSSSSPSQIDGTDTDKTDKDECTNPPEVTMTEDQKRRLNELGFFYNSIPDPWDEIEKERWPKMFQLLKDYKTKYGDCNVPTTTTHPKLQGKYKPLAIWVKKQRDEINAFDTQEQQQHQQQGDDVEEEQAGNHRVTTDGVGNQSKSSSKQQPKRRQRRRTTMRMTEKRKRLLLDLGLARTVKTGPQWSSTRRQEVFDESFQKKLEELKAYKAEHGNIDVPASSKLAKWLWKVRRDYNQLQEGKEVPLKLEHVVALTSLGFTMKGLRCGRISMDVKVRDYIHFVNSHNGQHPKQKSKDEEESRLGRYALAWRQMKKLAEKGVTKHPKLGNTVIDPELMDQLTEVGFRWQSKDIKVQRKLDNASWEEKFERLRLYKEKHKHCEPPIRHPTLGSFVFEQRRQYKYMNQGMKSNLTLERFQKLSELGFRFKVAGTGHSRLRLVDDKGSDCDSNTGGGVHHPRHLRDTAGVAASEDEQQPQQLQQRHPHPDHYPHHHHLALNHVATMGGVGLTGVNTVGVNPAQAGVAHPGGFDAAAAAAAHNFQMHWAARGLAPPY